jgi:HK97 family phage prohead protease
MSEILTRSAPFELSDTVTDDDGLRLSGYAAVFNTPSRIRERRMEFDEVIAPGSFHRAVNAKQHVIMQWNHGQDPAIGDTPLGRIDLLREDERGLYVEAHLNKAAQFDGVRQAIKDGAVTGMSFRFSIPDGGDAWDRSGDIPVRTINTVHLLELGPVAYPAYPTTSVAIRSQFRLLDSDQQFALLDELRSEARPEDGSPPPPDDTVARPEDGSRRTRNQRRALVVLAEHAEEA